MDFGSWGNALGTIAACCGVGAFVDFYIGQAGQKRVKGWLETWWLRLSYVKWGNFGREEALFALQVIDKFLGKSFFSVKRLYAVMLTAIISFSIGLITSVDILRNLSNMPEEYELFTLINIFIGLTLFSISISITRAAASLVSLLLKENSLYNFAVFLFLMVIQYLVLCLWPVVLETSALLSAMIIINFNTISLSTITKYLGIIYKDMLSHNFTLDPKIVFEDFLYLYYIKGDGTPDSTMVLVQRRVNTIITLLPNLGRMLVALIFVGSFILKPLQHPISTLWARVVESDKPVFTVVFGAVAALVKLLQEIAKNF